MSPILVRPVREQLEHDRVIRLLQAKYKRKFDALINPGHEQAAPVLVGDSPWYPDVVLYSLERGRRLMGTVEVETAESVNNLEAMSQWRTFGGLKAAFHLYVPASSIDTARRMAADLQVNVAELWAYSPLGDQMRFVLIQRSAASEAKARAAAASEARARTAAAAKPAPEPARAVSPRPAPPRPAPVRAAAPARPASARPVPVAPRGSNGRAKPAPATPVRPAARRAAAPAAAKSRRTTAPAAARGTTKNAAARRPAAKKPAARTQKRK